MITKWWKNYIKGYLSSGGSAYGFNLPIKATNGTIYYVTSGSVSSFGNPTFQLNATNAGISVGTGDNTATDEDYILQTTITSGLSASITVSHGMDTDKPYVTYNMVLTNSTASDITIKEIGYKLNIPGVTSVGATSGSSTRSVMIDRTVLSTPITVPAGGNAAILYTLKTDYTF